MKLGFLQKLKLQKQEVDESMNTEQHDVQIFSQTTPNPHARKFILSEFAISHGKKEFSTLEEAANFPLIYHLLSLDGVSQVHVYENVITVTQNGEKDWGELAESIENVIRTFFSQHDPDALAAFQKEKKRELTGELKVIDDILSEEIRPALQYDGGDIELVDYQDKVLKIRYQGACGSCPSAMMGTLHAITSTLRQRYDEDIEVVVVDNDFY